MRCSRSSPATLRRPRFFQASDLHRSVQFEASRQLEVIRIGAIKSGSREFTTAQIHAASQFIESFPPGVRVNVDEWVQERWRFVFREMPKLALEALHRVTPGSRFRVRPVSILLS